MVSERNVGRPQGRFLSPIGYEFSHVGCHSPPVTLTAWSFISQIERLALRRPGSVGDPETKRESFLGVIEDLSGGSRVLDHQVPSPRPLLSYTRLTGRSLLPTASLSTVCTRERVGGGEGTVIDVDDTLHFKIGRSKIEGEAPQKLKFLGPP